MKTCFVIMPFSETSGHTQAHWTWLFDEFIRPSVEAHGYRCVRSAASPRNIIAGIVHELFTVDVVLAVLTDFNPNVWYELGTRHSLRRGTIMVIDKDQELPFDIRHFGCIFYSQYERPSFELEVGIFLNAIEESNRPDSPVFEYFTSSPVQMAAISSSVLNSGLTFEDALDTAQQSMLVVGQNLNSLATDSRYKLKLFSTLEEKDVTVQLMVCDPNQTEIVEATGKFTGGTNFPEQLKDSVSAFTNWQKEIIGRPSKIKGRLEVRGSGQIGNVSVTFVDPLHQNARMLITPVIWTTLPTGRPCIWIDRCSHPQIFQHYHTLYETIWRAALPLT